MTGGNPAKDKKLILPIAIYAMLSASVKGVDVGGGNAVMEKKRCMEILLGLYGSGILGLRKNVNVGNANPVMDKRWVEISTEK